MTKKVKDLIKVLKDNGWYIERTNKHHIFEHETKKTLNGRPLTVSKHENEDLSIGTYNNILKNAGLK
jgi:predicted RNA binding protein YcfA (HicA-like mRNA interferase family)